MLPWLLYATSVGVAAGVAGVVAEHGLWRLRRPVRHVWVWTMASTVGLPLVVLAMRVWGAPDLATGSEASFPWGLGWWSGLPAGLVSGRADVLVAASWAGLSVGMLANVRLAAWTLRRNARGWRSASVGGRRVAVSSEFGPGVVGVARPRMVLPAWVLEAPAPLRHLVALHEVEHVRARDTRLLLGGVIATLLAPWCLPLWWQAHRLRRAIETDCDARVVETTGQPAAYAHALLEVAGRRTPTAAPVPALAPRASELERRIRLVTAAGRRRSPVAGLVSIAVAFALWITLIALPAPDPPIWRSDPPPAGPPPTATVILGVMPEGPGG